MSGENLTPVASLHRKATNFGYREQVKYILTNVFQTNCKTSKYIIYDGKK